MTREIARLLSDLRQELNSLYGGRLRGVYLYGSYARGEEDAESDVDVVVVLDDVPHYAGEVDRTSRLVSELSLRYGVSVSRVFVPHRDWVSGDTTFLANAREEALPA